MRTIEDLRPEIRELDPEWSASTLRSILAEPSRGRRAQLALVNMPLKRVRLAVGVVAAAAVISTVGLAGPFGSPGTPAAAAQLTAAHLSVHPEVGSNEFLHLKRVKRVWGYGGAAVVDPFTLEYWLPGDGESEWTERSGVPGSMETNSFEDWGPSIYVEHSPEPAELLEELREYATSQAESADLHGLWTAAFWIVTDPVAPQPFKDEVMKAVSTLEGVEVADPDFRVTGLSGQALTMGSDYDPWFVIDPKTTAFRGIVGHPEKDDTWVGPQEPMWTITIESSVTTEAP